MFVCCQSKFSFNNIPLSQCWIEIWSAVFEQFIQHGSWLVQKSLCPQTFMLRCTLNQQCDKRYYEIEDAFSKTFVIKCVLYPKILCIFSSELLYIYCFMFKLKLICVLLFTTSSYPGARGKPGGKSGCALVLGKDAKNEALGRKWNKHGHNVFILAHVNEEISERHVHKAVLLGKILCPNDHNCMAIRELFSRKRHCLKLLSEYLAPISRGLIEIKH